jgi:spermidine synthase
MSTYVEHSTIDESCVEWKHVTIKDTIKTHRETLVEMVERPEWGMTCYMDRVIQSCEQDESLYHESLVHPVMVSTGCRKRVMIVGGGEGATAREVLKWSDVEHVDMYEWDRDIVSLFSKKYPQWAKGAWNHPKLSICYEDIFEAITSYPSNRYDVIIIDLFDPSDDNMKSWAKLFQHLPYWMNDSGTMVCYAGIRSLTTVPQNYQSLLHIIHSKWNSSDKEIIPYRVFIPSFLGESIFILAKSRHYKCAIDKIKSYCHITKEIWKSYKAFNW